MSPLRLAAPPLRPLTAGCCAVPLGAGRLPAPACADCRRPGRACLRRYLVKVVLTCMQTGRAWTFRADRWLAANGHDVVLKPPVVTKEGDGGSGSAPAPLLMLGANALSQCPLSGFDADALRWSTPHWLRQLELEVGETPGSSRKAEWSYRLSFVTGVVLGSGTDAPVSCRLLAKDPEAEPWEPEIDNDDSRFESGKTDVFRIRRAAPTPALRCPRAQCSAALFRVQGVGCRAGPWRLLCQGLGFRVWGLAEAAAPLARAAAARSPSSPPALRSRWGPSA